MSGKEKEAEFMAYTPELSQKSSCILRRIAWALGIPMTEAIERVFEHIPDIVDRGKVCEGCRNRIYLMTPATCTAYAKRLDNPMRR
jgi:hypothetical protein